MPAYLYTLHAYRSWMPDHPRGYVQRGEGVLPPDTQKATTYAARATHNRVVFDETQRRQLLDASRQAAQRWEWRWHAGAAVWSHMHVLLSWIGDRDAYAVRRLLKRSLTQALGGNGPWFSRAGSVKRVRDQEHFDVLVHRYLPAHRKHGGCFEVEQA